jgi:hypothetical protein
MGHRQWKLTYVFLYLFRDGTAMTGPLAGGNGGLNKVWSRCGADKEGISQSPQPPKSIENTNQKTHYLKLKTYSTLSQFIPSIYQDKNKSRCVHHLQSKLYDRTLPPSLAARSIKSTTIATPSVGIVS